MYAPVGHQSARIIPKPTESKMKTVRVEGSFRGGSQPTSIIYSGGYRSIWFFIKGLFPIQITPNLYGTDISQFSAMHKINGISKMLLTTLPLTCLHNLVISHLRFHHGAAFGNGIPYWFFNIHMFASFAGMYHL